MRCPACRRDVPESSRFCLACGARVDSSQAPTITAAAASPPSSSGSPPSSDALDGAQFIPGTMLAGRYRIVGLLGRGGMGEVYRAEDLKLGQPVALKFLSKQFTDRADRLARFHQEVRLARQVSHPLMPIALDSSVPYAFSSRLIVATVIALAAYGWHTALAGRPMLGAMLLKDAPVRRA